MGLRLRFRRSREWFILRVNDSVMSSFVLISFFRRFSFRRRGFSAMNFVIVIAFGRGIVGVGYGFTFVWSFLVRFVVFFVFYFRT